MEPSVDRLEPAPRPEAPERPASRWRWLDTRLIASILALKAVFYFYGTQAYQVLTNAKVGGFERWLDIWNRWDATHYVELARHGYQTTGEGRDQIVFYPLFPWATRLTALLLGNHVLSGLVVACVASIAAGLLLKELVRLDHPVEIADRSVWFMFVFPGSAVLHLPYTEGLLLALAIASLLAARRDRWFVAGLLGGAACLTRTNGLALVPALMAEATQQLWLTRRWNWRWLWIALVGLGVLGYLLLNQWVHRDPFMFMTIRREHLHQTLSWPWVGIREKIAVAVHGVGEPGAILGVQDLLFIVLGLAASVWSCLRLRAAYAVWMVGNWLMFTSTGFLIGLSRFSLVLFPIFVLFARLSASRAWYAAITAWSLLFLALFTGLYVEGHWIF